MREQWACPDVGVTKPDGYYNPIPGSREAFDDCPAYYLRTASSGLPAEHLIDGVTHPAELVGQWAFEVESGARQVDSLSPKAIEGVHLWFREKRGREQLEDELRRKKR
jgi:hypothetical protein